MNNFKNYLDMPLTLTLEQMNELHTQMLDEIGTDTDAAEIYEELIAQAVKYADFRAKWFLWSREQRLDRDLSRTMTHDSLIVKFNMLARYLKMNGQTASWRDILGDEQENPYVRKRIGDFACYLVFVNAICAR